MQDNPFTFIHLAEHGKVTAEFAISMHGVGTRSIGVLFNTAIGEEQLVFDADILTDKLDKWRQKFIQGADVQYRH
jgi:hypothetical protein